MELPPEIQEKWDKLDKRIKEVRDEHQEDAKERYGEETEEMSEESKKSARAGSLFLSSVIAGGLFGYVIDWFFNTLPLGLLSFIVIGFVNAVIRANAAMKED